MKRSMKIWMTVVLVLVGANSVQAKYGGGQGTEAEPYLIYEPNQLNEIGLHSEDWDKHFRLMADINLALAEPNILTTALIAPDTDNTNGDFDGIPFEGVFQGGGHLIRNITIDTDEADNDYLGLFGQISGEQAQVKNLGLENVSVIDGGNSSYLGGLSGRNYGAISNCYSNINVSGNGHVGGLCGFNVGAIGNCYVTGSVSGGGADPWRLGGLCGENAGTISNCYATSSVIGGSYSDYLGGLCGYNNGTINNCYATGSVAGYESRYLGGLCGKNSGGFIICCFWDIETSRQTWSDGGTGLSTEDMQKMITFTNWNFLDVWAIGENQTYPYLRKYLAADINLDGIVNLLDIVITGRQWLAVKE